jgi:hypothetical protein
MAPVARLHCSLGLPCPSSASSGSIVVATGATPVLGASGSLSLATVDGGLGAAGGITIAVGPSSGAAEGFP